MRHDLRNSAQKESNRFAVRLLFVGFSLVAVILVLIRANYGEPYPAFFMPGFKGTGLTMVSTTEASDVVPKYIVTFSDRTTAEVSEGLLFADIPQIAVHRSILFSICPNPDAVPFDSHRKGYGKWLTALFPGHYLAPPPPPAQVPGDAIDYFRRRLVKIYPDKAPESMTISLYRETFPVDDFHKMNVVLVKQTVVSFHESI